MGTDLVAEVAVPLAIIAATKGEYKGTGRTQAERQPAAQGIDWFAWIAGIFLISTIVVSKKLWPDSSKSRTYGRSSGNSWWNDSGGGGGFGGGSSGGGGGFSGGGGSFGGGGSGGSW